MTEAVVVVFGGTRWRAYVEAVVEMKSRGGDVREAVGEAKLRYAANVSEVLSLKRDILKRYNKPLCASLTLPAVHRTRSPGDTTWRL